MYTKFTSLLFVTFAFMMSGSAYAVDPSGIYVEYWTNADLCPGNPSQGDGWTHVSGFPDRGANCPGATPEPGLSNGANISFTGGTNINYRILAWTGESIGNITVNGTDVIVLIGQVGSTNPPFISDTSPLTLAAAPQVGNISVPDGAVQIRCPIVGTVSAKRIARIDAKTSIVSASTTAQDIAAIRAPSIGNVSAFTNIGSLQIVNWETGGPAASNYAATASANGSIVSFGVTGARLTGTVKADTGSVNTVSCTGTGSGIGTTTGTPATIRARDGINLISAASIAANIDAHYNSGSGVLQSLVATGNFSGSLQAAGIGSTGAGVSVGGVLSATVTITGNVQKPFAVTGATTSPVSLQGTISQPVTFTGGFSGSSLTLGALTSTVTVGGSLAAPTTIASTASGSSVTINGGIPATNTVAVTNAHAGSLVVTGTASGLISVGGSLTGPMTFGSSTNPGLNGQVIVGASGTGSWTGSVRVRDSGASSVLIGPVPEYDDHSDVLGTDADGGAVGQASFSLHSDDCLPDNTVTSPSYVRFDLSTAPSSTQVHRFLRSSWFAGHDVIRTRFYGPLTVSDEVEPGKYYDGNICDPASFAGGEGVTVEYNPYNAWAYPQYTVDVTDHFYIMRDGGDLNRDLILLPICGSDLYQTMGAYRVIRNHDRESGWDMTGPFASRLRSGHVTGTPEVQPFAHYFSFNIGSADIGVQGGTPGSDGILDNNDFIVFIAWHFAHDTRADIGVQGGVPGSDNLWDNNDYIVFTDRFFSPDQIDGEGNSIPFADCDCGNRPAPFQGGSQQQAMSGGEQAQESLSTPERQRQLEALWTIYDSTHDQRVLQRILDLGFSVEP